MCINYIMSYNKTPNRHLYYAVLNLFKTKLSFYLLTYKTSSHSKSKYNGILSAYLFLEFIIM